MMTGVLDDTGLLDDEAPDRQPAAGGTAFVCDFMVDDHVCGETFDVGGRLNQHRALVHKVKKDGTAFSTGGPRKKKATSDKKPTRTKKPTALPTPEVDRTAAYTAGIATIGLGMFLAVPGFDDFDHTVVNSGAPTMAAALDALGERHPSVRDACDLILGAGSGGPYVQLLLASLAIGVPIAAHHGWLPSSAGERFGSLAGVTMPPVEHPAPRPDADVDNGAREWTADELYEALVSAPPTVAADLAGRMMQGAGATYVEVPDNPTAKAPDGEPGSEQLPPDIATDATDVPVSP
jgi:hypothetical protein